MRATQFLNSLHEVNDVGANNDKTDVDKTDVNKTENDKTEAPIEARPALPVVSAPLGEDFGNRVKERATELQDKAGTTASAASPTDPGIDAAGEPALPAGAAARMGQLQALRDRGLITPDEYQEKRQSILEGL